MQTLKPIRITTGTSLPRSRSSPSLDEPSDSVVDLNHGQLNLYRAFTLLKQAPIAHSILSLASLQRPAYFKVVKKHSEATCLELIEPGLKIITFDPSFGNSTTS